MKALPPQNNPPVNDGLHPTVYKSLIALTIWLLLSIWFLFDRGAYVGLIVAMITVFFLILTGIQILIWLSWRRRASDARPERTENFRAWASQRFRTWTGDLTGGAAAVQILLPIMAVAFGMTIFGVIFDLTVPHIGT
jgi:hypothetical protein